jgi:hypothetical protein
MSKIAPGCSAVTCTGQGFVSVTLESSPYSSAKDQGGRKRQFQCYGGDVRIVPSHIADMLIDQHPDRFRWATNDEIEALT